MSRLTELLRRALARHGYLIHRLDPGIPPSLVDYLRELLGRTVSPDSVLCFDTNSTIQSEILSLFQVEQVSFVPPLATNYNGMDLRDTNPARRLVEIDAEVYEMAGIESLWPAVFESAFVVLKCPLGYFWAGEGDVTDICSFMSARGYRLHDVLDYSKPGLLNGLLGRVAFAFERGEASFADSPPPDQQLRIQEARAFLSQPVAGRGDLRWHAGRGSFGCAAGVFNPGAVNDGNGFLLLANGEALPWAQRKASQAALLASCTSVLIRLADDGTVSGHFTLTSENAQASPPSRLEDFRLLRFRGEILSNHAVISLPLGNGQPVQPVSLPTLTTRIGLSRIDQENKRLVFLGFPGVDLQTRQTEKNWAMFTREDEFYLLYSFSPYRLLRLNRWPALDFSTCLNRPLNLPFAAVGQSVRNSINPVNYDPDHWLHVVHMVYPTKQYVYWAVLIDKGTLLPILVSARPLACGWHSSPTSIIYASSIALQDKELILFAGLDDSSLASWRIPRARLDAEWIPLVTASRQ
jgi:hypothetical protein